MPPESIFHAIVGTAGLVTGIAALASRKGARWHRVLGTIFFAVMLTTAASGAYLAISREQPSNAIAGIVTIYLLLTSWVTVRRAEGKLGVFEFGAFFFSAAAAAAAWYFAITEIRAGGAMLGGIPYLVISSIISIAALADLSVLIRRGIAGRQRIARHLWRMQLGFAAAVGSFFPGQLEIFPAFIREFKPFIVLFIPFFAVIGLMFLWLAIVLFTNWFKNRAIIAAPARAADAP